MDQTTDEVTNQRKSYKPAVYDPYMHGPTEEQPVDYGPPNAFREMIVPDRDNYGGEIIIRDLELPKQTPECVLVFNDFSEYRVKDQHRIPFIKKFKFEISAFKGTFLEDLIAFDDFKHYINYINKRLKQEVRYKLGTCKLRCYLALLATMMFACFVCCTYLFPASIQFGKEYPITIVLLVLFMLVGSGFGYMFLSVEKKLDSAIELYRDEGYRSLVEIVNQTKDQFSSKGILVRPGNYGIFIMFVPMD